MILTEDSGWPRIDASYTDLQRTPVGAAAQARMISKGEAVHLFAEGTVNSYRMLRADDFILYACTQQ